MRFEACYLDADTQMWEQYTIEAVDEQTAKRQAEKIAKIENKFLILFKRQVMA